MKLVYIITISIILSIVLLSSTCANSNPEDKEQQEYSTLDSIWLPFAKAMGSKNIEFLINNSLDSLTCYDCGIGSNNQKVYFDSRFVLENHVDKIMHVQTLSNNYFSTYQVENNQIKIVYQIKAKQAPEGGYSLIFTLVKKDKEYRFQGMMVQ